MTDYTSYSTEVNGYTNHGITYIAYAMEDGAELSVKLDVFTCNVCAATVLGAGTVVHTAWHNPEASA